MINVTASLQIRNGIYQAVLSYKKNEKWETKWKSTGIKAIKGNKKKAETKKEEIRKKFQEEINSDNIDNEDILYKWQNDRLFQKYKNNTTKYKAKAHTRVLPIFIR